MQKNLSARRWAIWHTSFESCFTRVLKRRFSFRRIYRYSPIWMIRNPVQKSSFWAQNDKNLVKYAQLDTSKHDCFAMHRWHSNVARSRLISCRKIRWFWKLAQILSCFAVFIRWHRCHLIPRRKYAGFWNETQMLTCFTVFIRWHRCHLRRAVKYRVLTRHSQR